MDLEVVRLFSAPGEFRAAEERGSLNFLFADDPPGILYQIRV